MTKEKTFGDVLRENKTGLKAIKHKESRRAAESLIDDLIEIWERKYSSLCSWEGVPRK